ncbi:MAG TPA: cbb3-type cytochrome oxidase assembly protein CcoS [Methylomirabilota bacterium]|nr:cbb3-type cytochrome oxidase assembly protein CcoS [Methylomirabilota bacterium]
MAVMFVLLPVALLFAAAAVVVFLWAVHAGQFDDLDTPPLRILVEDDGDGMPPPPAGRA